jgi:hypothetical protein
MAIETRYRAVEKDSLIRLTLFLRSRLQLLPSQAHFFVLEDSDISQDKEEKTPLDFPGTGPLPKGQQPL